MWSCQNHAMGSHVNLVIKICIAFVHYFPMKKKKCSSTLMHVMFMLGDKITPQNLCIVT